MSLSPGNEAHMNYLLLGKLFKVRPSDWIFDKYGYWEARKISDRWKSVQHLVILIIGVLVAFGLYYLCGIYAVAPALILFFGYVLLCIKREKSRSESAMAWIKAQLMNELALEDYDNLTDEEKYFLFIFANCAVNEFDKFYSDVL